MKDIDSCQSDFTELAKRFMRTELTQDHYQGKVKCVIVSTNSVTGKVNIDTCNVNLIGEAKAILLEAYEQLQRGQQANALASIIRNVIKEDKEANVGRKKKSKQT